MSCLFGNNHCFKQENSKFNLFQLCKLHFGHGSSDLRSNPYFFFIGFKFHCDAFSVLTFLCKT